MNKKILSLVLMLSLTSVGYAGVQEEALNESFYGVGFYNSTTECFVSDSDDLSRIIDDCALKASKVTSEVFSDFDHDEYISGYVKVDNARTRMWYNEFLKAYNDNWKKWVGNQNGLEDAAETCYKIRKYAKDFTRDRMDDRNNIDTLKDRDLSFIELIEHKKEKQRRRFESKHPGQEFEDSDFDLERAYKGIIESSTKTNPWVNAFMNCYKYSPFEMPCDFIGGVAVELGFLGK